MNQENNTVISAEMLKQLKELGLAGDYKEVAKRLEAEAARILADKDIADIDEPTKNRFIEASNDIEELEPKVAPESQSTVFDLRPVKP